MQNSISIDWETLHVSLSFKNFNERQFKTLYCERQPIQTRNFCSVWDIYDKGTNEIVAVLACEPRSAMCMKENSGLLKIINKYLYNKDLIVWVEMLMQELALGFINLTRIDIAMDFLSFDTMTCPEFIGGCIGNSDAPPKYIKTLANKIKAMGESVTVKDGELVGGFTSLKYGMETSDICYYLYNKTLELEQVKDKPWIKDHWKANGWDGKKDVWRLEFSLKSTTDGLQIVDPDTGETELFTFKSLSLMDHIEKIYSYLFNRYFSFVHVEQTKRGKYKKQCRCKKVVLFNQLKMIGVRIGLSAKKDSSRSDKVFLKKFKQLNEELRGVDRELGIIGNEIFAFVAMSKDLGSWVKNKLGTDLDFGYSDKLGNTVMKWRLQKMWDPLIKSAANINMLNLQQKTIPFA
jgi:hypothetical protein